MGVTAGSGRPIRAWEVLVVEGLQELGLYIWPQERQQDGLLELCRGLHEEQQGSCYLNPCNGFLLLL